MAHVEHFKKSDVKNLVNEYDRDEKYMKSKDVSRIDLERVQNDYVLTQNEFARKQSLEDYRNHTRPLANKIESRLADSDLTVSTRKDLNVMSTWVVTCPQELVGDKEKEDRFFEMVYGYTIERYGKNNVLDGFVHKDETTPHIHIPVIPVKDGRVSSKALFTKSELRNYQRDLDKACEQEFGIKGLILNGRTKGNYTVSELKERSLNASEAQKRDLELRVRESSLNARETSLNALERRLEIKGKELQDKEREIALKGKINARLDALEQYVRENPSKPRFASAVNEVKIRAEAISEREASQQTERSGNLSYT